MKAFSIAAAVTLVLAFVCFVEIRAVPFTTAQQLHESQGHDNNNNDDNDTPAETPVDSHMMVHPVRVRRWSHIHLCRWCRDCCDSSSWVYCCRISKTSK